MTVGCLGAVSVASHLVAKEIQEMIHAFEAGNTKLATEIQFKLYPLFKVLFCATNPIPIKAALKMQGWELGTVRQPLSELSSELKPQLENVLNELKLI